MINPASPLGYLVTLLEVHRYRASRAERGASALEWVIIAGLVLAIVLFVGDQLRRALEDKSTEVGNEIRE